MPAMIACAAILASVAPVPAGDWPQWRCDAARTGATPDALPADIKLLWSRELGEVKPAWPHEPRLHFDASLHPIVLGKTLFVGSSRDDKLVALDTDTGTQRWSFFAEGPIRLAPAAADGKVYVASDDGRLYCLSAAGGRLLWKFRGADSMPDRRVMGNGRLISAWPARGGPVVADGKVCFAAGIWPFMGIFVHCLDAQTGKVIWTNDSSGSTWVGNANGHDEAQAFSGPSPQGHLAIIGRNLLVPCGRSPPACFDLKTGRLLWYKPNETHVYSGPHVCAAGRYVFCSGPHKSAVLDVASGEWMGYAAVRPVLAGDVGYAAGGGFGIKWATSTQTTPASGIKGVRQLVRFPQVGGYRIGDLLLKAGSRLYGGAADSVTAIEASVAAMATTAPAKATWTGKITGTAVEALAADGKLFVVTKEGGIFCFGEDKVASPTAYPLATQPALVTRDEVVGKAREVLSHASIKDGVCVVAGVVHGRLVEELVAQSTYHVIAIDPDPAKIATIQKRFDEVGLYGRRVSAIVGDLKTPDLPACMASLLTTEDENAMGLHTGERLFSVLRPYGGVACWRETGDAMVASQAIDRQIGKIEKKTAKGLDSYVRPDGPPGSANWDHEFGDAAKSLCSRDKVRGPFGVLWFGGAVDDADLFIPSWLGGPGVQVADGRMYIEGRSCLNCIDAYTGMVLWKAEIPAPATNAYGHGRNIGYYFAVAKDAVYAGYHDTCYKLDVATGQTKAQFKLPAREGRPAPLWGYMSVVDDVLVAVSAEPIDFWAAGAPADAKKLTLREVQRFIELHDALSAVKLAKPGETDRTRLSILEDSLAGLLDGSGIAKKLPEAPTKKALSAERFGLNALGLRAGEAVVAFDRNTGKQLWRRDLANGVSNDGLAIANGKVYCLDAISPEAAALASRHGIIKDYRPRLIALDLKTGREVWAVTEGLWPQAQRLACAATQDVVIVESQHGQARSGKDGSVLWDNKQGRVWDGGSIVDRPPVIRPDGRVITYLTGAVDVLTGRRVTRDDPLTGAQVPWEWRFTRMGCGFQVGSENMILCRSSTAAYWDMNDEAGMTNLGGFRTGCRNNLVAACGIVSVPRFTGCNCGYPIQASVALIHDDSVEQWSSGLSGPPKGRVKRIGLNLGAPGDRRDPSGTLWLDYPSRGGPSPDVPVKVSPDGVEWFCRHSSRIKGPGLAWVAASGAKGIESISVTLAAGAKDQAAYTVRLHFAEPDDVQAGQRIFSVSIQGREVLKDFDVVKEAGAVNRAVVKEFRDITIGQELNITLAPSPDAKVKQTVLCGIEAAIQE